MEVQVKTISGAFADELAAAPKNQKTAETTNRYLMARREWDERYGSLITRARNWRWVAMVCAITVLIQAAGMIVVSMRRKVIPYVVAVDALGQQVAAGAAEESSTIDDRLKRAALFSWIEDLRTVTSDGIAQRKAIDRVYARIANGSPALTLINEFYRADPPQHRAKTGSVSVDVQSVLATSDATFQIEWTETARNLEGEIQSQERWKGAFTIAIHPPDEERLIRANPLGIYVTHASWTRVL